jgi:hypothetical protein
MPLNDKVRLFPNSRELICRETDIDIDDAAALPAGEMVMEVASTADTVVMRTIRKLDAGEQPFIHQLFDHAVGAVPSATYC